MEKDFQQKNCVMTHLVSNTLKKMYLVFLDSKFHLSPNQHPLGIIENIQWEFSGY